MGSIQYLGQFYIDWQMWSMHDERAIGFIVFIMGFGTCSLCLSGTMCHCRSYMYLCNMKRGIINHTRNKSSFYFSQANPGSNYTLFMRDIPAIHKVKVVNDDSKDPFSYNVIVKSFVHVDTLYRSQ